MSWRLSKALIALKAEVDAEHPHRSKISDGTIGDPAHQARVSDHNPDADGVVHAWDVTADPIQHVAQQVVDFLTTGTLDNRLKYVIWQRRIFSKRLGRWAWRAYTGANPHDHHAHISVYGDDGAPWGYPAKVPAWSPPVFPGTIGPDSLAERVAKWRMLLGAIGYKGFRVGMFPWSLTLGHATRRFQRRHGLAADGIVGPQTWAKAVAVLVAKRKAKGLPT